jgi:hypothetical protein
VGQFLFQIPEDANEASQHGQAFQWSEFWPKFLESTFENWQSEFLQLFTFVVLTAYFIHKGSHESKDTDEEMQAALSRIEKQLQGLKPSKKRS